MHSHPKCQGSLASGPTTWHGGHILSLAKERALSQVQELERMNLSIEDALPQPCPPSWTLPLPSQKGQKQQSPLPPALRCTCSPHLPAFAAPLGTNTGLGFPWQMPRHLGLQFTHRLGNRAQTFCLYNRLVTDSFLDPCSSFLDGFSPPLSPPSHPSNPLSQSPLGPGPGPDLWQPAPAFCPTAPCAPVCLPRFRLQASAPAIAATRKPLAEFRRNLTVFVPTHHLLTRVPPPLDTSEVTAPSSEPCTPLCVPQSWP